MKTVPIPDNEAERLRALYTLNILDTQPEDVYDRVTRIAAKLFDAKMSSVCFVDKDRVWLKSGQGLDTREIPRSESFCGYTICQNTTEDIRSRIFEVPDASTDPRFVDNPLVINEPRLRYYMGFVLKTTSNANVGTFCIMDTRPRQLDDNERDILIDLGNMVDERLKEVDIASNFNFYDLDIASKVTHKVFAEMDDLLKRKGINLLEWRVLDQVINTNFATPTQIGKKLGLASSQVSKLLELLEAKGLIRRVRSIEKSDRRLVKLECIAEGKEVWAFGKRMGDQIVEKIRI